jgi:DNA-directed RNA polymerase subunit M/transcription elongation factor TFIIS
MSFDKAGVTPGLASENKAEPAFQHMKCRNENCQSVQAREIVSSSAPPGAGAPHNRLYQCVKCNHTWSLGVGGSVNF